jgi:hypothetical protein
MKKLCQTSVTKSAPRQADEIDSREDAGFWVPMAFEDISKIHCKIWIATF